MTNDRVAEGNPLSLWRWQKSAALIAAFACSAAAIAQSNSTPQTAPSSAPTGITAPAATPPSTSAQASSQASPEPAGETGKRAQSYYHFALGHLYEESAEQYGRPELAVQAIEQYKLAITHDPDSVFLQNTLAETYFKLGRIREAIETAQRVLKTQPDNLQAHKLLGRVYLRSLGDTENGQQPGPMLDLAIQEFQKIVAIEPDQVEDRLLLGQLYTLKHDTKAAEAQFEEARQVDPNSEDVVLNLARLYGEQNNLPAAISVLQSVPPDDRTFKIDLALAAAYDQSELYGTKIAFAHCRKALRFARRRGRSPLISRVSSASICFGCLRFPAFRNIPTWL